MRHSRDPLVLSGREPLTIPSVSRYACCDDGDVGVDVDGDGGQDDEQARITDFRYVIIPRELDFIDSGKNDEKTDGHPRLYSSCNGSGLDLDP